jgi:peptide/nickel transport system ATP-binding protein
MTELIYDIRDLVRTYHTGTEEVRAVDHISLFVAHDERLGIVGESGSGKSTLIRMMAALDQPTSGEILFQGQSIVGVPDRKLGFLRSKVQMVFQDPRSSLNPRMTVEDIITEPLRSPRLRRNGGTPADRRARLKQVMDAVGLPIGSETRYPHEFSGGQRQRIAIARALAPRPLLLIADEPVSALDVSVRNQVLNLLSDLVAELGMAMVFVSHDLGVVRHMCERVIVMQHGKIVETGRTADVYADPQDEYTKRLLAAQPRIRIN